MAKPMLPRLRHIHFALPDREDELPCAVLCPACQTSADLPAHACPACGFSLAAADQALGVPPTHTVPVSDARHFLTAGDVRRIERTMRRIEDRFPQVQLAVVLEPIPAEISLGVFTFWLFNRGGLSSAVEKGAHNHLVLLVIDPGEAAEGRAACMIGYGLEPFISRDQLADCLDAMTGDLAASRYSNAAISFFETLEPILVTACQNAGPPATEPADQPDESAAPAGAPFETEPNPSASSLPAA